MNNQLTFNPNWVSKPGSTIYRILEKRNMSPNSLADKIGKSKDFVDALIKGSIAINNDIATLLEINLGSSSKFWLNRELNYRRDIERLGKEWLRQLPIKEMQTNGWINKASNPLKVCSDFFGIDDFNDWRVLYESQLETIKFRSSDKYRQEFGSTAVWLRQGEIQASKVKCKPWNPDLFEETLFKIKLLTRKKRPKEFLPELIESCANCGVSVSIVKTPKGCRANGATKFLNEDRAMLLLSFRYLSDDQFWFTFFHEAGHILMHGDKRIFLESMEGQVSKSTEENDANTFAGEILVPNELHRKFPKVRSNRKAIVALSMEAGVSPGILVGQMQHHGYVSPQYLNGFKRRYNWEEINQAYFEVIGN